MLINKLIVEITNEKGRWQAFVVQTSANDSVRGKDLLYRPKSPISTLDSAKALCRSVLRDVCTDLEFIVDRVFDNAHPLDRHVPE